MARDFDAWFREFTSWGLTQDELIACSCKPGDGAGDVVFTNARGNEMSRHMCNRWLDFYSAASAGWNAALAEAK